MQNDGAIVIEGGNITVNGLVNTGSISYTGGSLDNLEGLVNSGVITYTPTEDATFTIAENSGTVVLSPTDFYVQIVVDSAEGINIDGSPNAQIVIPGSEETCVPPNRAVQGSVLFQDLEISWSVNQAPEGQGTSVTFVASSGIQSWLAVGFNNQGRMSGQNAVIYKPDLGEVTVNEISGYSADSIDALDCNGEGTCLECAQFRQDSEGTTLEFTFSFENDQESIPQLLLNEEFFLIYAYGASNTFTYHEQNRGFSRVQVAVTDAPTIKPTQAPTPPTASPSYVPTADPSASPSSTPSSSPSPAPSLSPTASPTSVPTVSPSSSPTGVPTPPTPSPTAMPSNSPSQVPTAHPSESPSKSPTASPSPAPSPTPTASPSVSPSESPSASPTPAPTSSPTPSPTHSPTAAPTVSPTGPPAPVEIVGEIVLIGVTISDIAESVILALVDIIADLLGVPAEAVSVTIEEPGVRRLQDDNQVILRYDVEAPPEQADSIVQMLTEPDFDEELDDQIENYEYSSNEDDSSLAASFATFQSAFEGSNVVEDSVQIITLSPTASPDLEIDDDESGLFSEAYVLGGIAAAGGLLLLVLVLVALKRKTANSGGKQNAIEVPMSHFKKQPSDLARYDNPMERLSGQDMSGRVPVDLI